MTVNNAMVKLGALAETHSFFRFRQALDQTLEDISGFWWEGPHTRLTRAREMLIEKNQWTLFCSPSGSRFVMLLRLMASVDMLCSSAEVVGGRMPSTPSTMSEKLKLTMKR